ncbi:phage portal protein [Gluconobacter albidus]|nr:phage portal protein [Gluconobacter albidus]
MSSWATPTITKAESAPAETPSPVDNAPIKLGPGAYVEAPQYWGPPSGMVGSGSTFSGIVVTPYTVMKSPTVFGCVTGYSSAIAKLPPNIQKIDSNGGWTNTTDHQLCGLLKTPNSKDRSWFQFMNNLMIHYVLWGNAYVAIIRGKDGRPVELITVTPDRMSVTELEDGDRLYTASTNQFKGRKTSFATETGQTRRLLQEDVIHLMHTNFENNIIGKGPLDLSPEVFGIDLAIQETRAGAFRNGTSIQYIITTTGRYKPEQLATIRENLMKGMAGTANVGMGPALPPDIQLVPMNLSVKDLMLPEMGEDSKRNICNVTNYPAHRLGLEDKDAAASIEQKERTFYSDTCGPVTTQFEELFLDKCFIASERDQYRMKYDYTQAVSPVYKDRVDAGSKAVVAGLLSPNEWRAREGLPGYEGGDEILRPLNTGAIGQTDGLQTTPGGTLPTDNDESENQS